MGLGDIHSQPDEKAEDEEPWCRGGHRGDYDEDGHRKEKSKWTRS